MISFNNIVTVIHYREWKEMTKMTGWLSTPTFLPLSECLGISATLGHVQQLHPKHTVPTFSPVYEEQKDQYFHLTNFLLIIFDLNHDRTEDMRRWWWLVHFKTMICFVRDAPYFWDRQELMRDGENCIPKQTDLSVGLSGGVGYISWNV